MRYVAAMLVALTSIVMPSVVQADGSGQASIPGGAIMFTAANAQFDGPGCAQIQLQATYSKPEDSILYITLTSRQVTSNALYKSTDLNAFPSDPASATRTRAICVDDSVDMSQGDFTIGGEWALDLPYGNDAEGLLPVVPVAVSQNPARFTSFKVKAQKKYTLGAIRGHVVATTLTKGEIGASGYVAVDRFTKGVWRSFDDAAYVNQYGRFTVTTYASIPRGTRFRARLTDCHWCTTAHTSTRAG